MNRLVRGKERQTSRLPLPQDVGDAILAYLADGRPCLDDEHVFLAVQAPIRKLRSSTAVSCIVGSAAKRAGVRMPRGRAHVLRHSCAMNVLRSTRDIRKVALWLGHEHQDTTEIYLHADPSVKLEIFEEVLPPTLRPGKFRPPDKLIAMLRPPGLCGVEQSGMPDSTAGSTASST